MLYWDRFPAVAGRGYLGLDSRAVDFGMGICGNSIGLNYSIKNLPIDETGPWDTLSTGSPNKGN
jgi:hypothetical protein